MTTSQINLDKNKLDELENIVSSVVAEFKNVGLSVFRTDQTIIIAAPSNEIVAIQNRLKTILPTEEIVVVDLPSQHNNRAQDIQKVIEFIHKDMDPIIPEFPDIVVTPPKQKFIETKSKQINHIQKNQFNGYARAQFNHRKHMHNIIRIKHK